MAYFYWQQFSSEYFPISYFALTMTIVIAVVDILLLLGAIGRNRRYSPGGASATGSSIKFPHARYQKLAGTKVVAPSSAGAADVKVKASLGGGIKSEVSSQKDNSPAPASAVSGAQMQSKASAAGDGSEGKRAQDVAANQSSTQQQQQLHRRATKADLIKEKLSGRSKQKNTKDVAAATAVGNNARHRHARGSGSRRSTSRDTKSPHGVAAGGSRNKNK